MVRLLRYQAIFGHFLIDKNNAPCLNRTMRRYLEENLLNDPLKSKKMAFLYGPRQVGKTTLAKNLLKELTQTPNYYNFDNESFKKLWIKDPNQLIENNSYKNPILVLDEIHKDHKWKNKIKGLYDTYGEHAKFIVTGSARLDLYKKSGDSLAGRYIPFRVHPFTYGESTQPKPPPKDDWFEFASKKFNFKELLELGGFPEPLLEGSKDKFLRWSRLQTERLIRED